MVQIINCVELAKNTISSVHANIVKHNLKLKLVVIMIGNSQPSLIYIKNKIKVCRELGIETDFVQLESNITYEEIKSIIDQYNNNPEVSGILVQLPLPESLQPYQQQILDLISAKKDVDGLTSTNQANLLQNNTQGYIPCTTLGILKILDSLNINLEGSRALVIGRSLLVGVPTFLSLNNRNATATLAHYYTKNLSELAKQSDIIISAVGKANLITADMIKEGSIIIDVGIVRIGNQLTGDVSKDVERSSAKYLTTVPNGVGKMTVASLIHNLYISHQY